jgi:nitroreductase
MQFDEPLTSTIQRRRSWRTFENRPLETAARSALLRAIAEPPSPPFANPVRLALLDAVEVGAEGSAKLGTYGVIRNPPCFLAGAVRAGEGDMEDFGYIFEHAILKATELGLQTCWLGGTLQRGRFGERLQAAEDELVPAVSPVGYARQRRSLVDLTFRAVAGSGNRKPWAELFFDGDFSRPLSPEAAGAQARALEMVRLGPSASNHQPWRIVRDRDGATLHLYLCRTAGYGRLFAVDLQRIDMGIAMSHLELVSREQGIEGAWRSSPPETGPLPERTRYVASYR